MVDIPYSSSVEYGTRDLLSKNQEKESAMSIVDGVVELSFKRLVPEAVIPSYKHYDDSGLDLHAIRDFKIIHGECTMVETGLAAEVVARGDIANFTIEIQVRPRSGLAMKEGITIINTPVTIDHGYRGPWKFPLTKLTKGEYIIKEGERFAQAVLCPVFSGPWMVQIQETDELHESTRGENGFGSTGRM